MTDEIQTTRELIAAFGKRMFDRKLTDMAGGNLSVRLGDEVLMTATLAGGLYHWDLRPEQILRMDLQGNKIDGKGDISREAKVHLALLNEFYPDGAAVVHAHARNVLVFCAAEKPMPPVLYATRKYGYVPQIVDAASGTDALAENVAAGVRGQKDWVKNKAAPVMAPRHGLFVLGKDLYAAIDAAERVDVNAYCILMGASLGVTPVGEDAPINPDYE